MNPYPCNTKEQKDAQRNYAALISDPTLADHLYDALSDSKGGTIISTDLARFLDPVYAAPASGSPRDLAPSWEHAWRYAQGRLEREVANRKRRKIIQFLSGGWGAGKTHAAATKPLSVDLTWDGTLAELPWAERSIDLCLKHGWKVVIFHVHRNVELALYGAIERAQTEGRSVPLRGLPGTHRQVQQTALALYRRYQRNKAVQFVFFHNTGTRQVAAEGQIVTRDELAFRGALHYCARYEAYHADIAEKIHAPR